MELKKKCNLIRFYEELKVFAWKGQRAEARRGFNDDLVMSMAIGCWLFDASSDYSKNSKMLNDAIMNAFQKKKILLDRLVRIKKALGLTSAI